MAEGQTNPTGGPVPVSAVFDGSGGFSALATPYDVAVFEQGNRTYAIVTGTADDGVQIMDITDPDNPVPISAVFDGSGGFSALATPFDVAIFEQGNRTYAIVTSNGDDGVQIMDITDPDNPVPVSAVFDGSGGFSALDGADVVEVFGQGGSMYAIVTGAADDGVQIMDITDPDNPVPISAVFDGSGGFSALSGANDVEVFGQGSSIYAIVTGTADDGVQIMDITDPDNPVPVSAVFDGSGGFSALSGASALDVFEQGGRAYAIVAVWNDDGVQIMDITDPDNPVPVSAVFDGSGGFSALSSSNVVEVFGQGGSMYAIVTGAADDGVQIMDITDPDNPVPVSAVFDGSGGFSALDWPVEVEVFGQGDRTYAIVTAYGDDGVQIMDITDSIGTAATQIDTDMPPEQQVYREVDVLVYGYNDGVRPITAGHVELLEFRGYTVDVSDGPVTAEQMERASVVVGSGLNVQDADAGEILTEYVHGGGRLLLLIGTEYATCGSTENPCWFDFTRDAFGFRFDIQSGTLIPAGGSGQHPIWNEPNTLREFSDWCCDGYVGEITDPQNVKVIATVAQQLYKHGAYTLVSGVPAIVVNDNPAWGGGMVVGGGESMVAGWHGPDMRMFDNIIGFMMPRVDVDMPPEQQEYGETGETVFAVLTVKPGQSTTLQDVNNLEFSCSGATAVRSVTFEGLPSDFGSFITLKIGVGSDTTDHQDLMLTDDGRDIYAATLDDPLEFGGGIFTLSGTIVGEDSVLVTVTYDTVRDEACEVVLDAAGSR